MRIFGYNQQPSFTHHRKHPMSSSIKEAVRTSILSRDWRYNWTTIPKLGFDEEEMFDEENMSPDNDWLCKRKLKIVSAISQVLFLHQGSIYEFSLSMKADSTYFELDQIILDLARNKNTLKKLTLHLYINEKYPYSYKLPLSIFSFQQLTNLYLTHSTFEFNPTFSAFGSLTSLYFHNLLISREALLHLLSNCPLLKRLKLRFEEECMVKCECITFHELSKCLPMVEHLSVNCSGVECAFQDYVWRELPTALVNLKYISLFWTVLLDECHAPLLCHVLRSSPNLEKIKLTMNSPRYWDSKLSDTLRDCSDILLLNLKELKITKFFNSEGEIRFVKLILAKSPVLKKVIIEDTREGDDRRLLRTLLQSPRASPSAEIIVVRRFKYWSDDLHFRTPIALSFLSL